MIVRRMLTLVAVAVGVHLLAVWGLPRLVMQRVTQTIETAALAAPGHVVLPPLPDATSRQVVMPSPDLLYALCVVDVSARPFRVRANPDWPHYWSVALYAANSDNIFVVNDRQLRDGAVDLWLTVPGAAGSAPPGATPVALTGHRALLLMRVLVPDATRDLAAAERARGTLHCGEG